MRRLAAAKSSSNLNHRLKISPAETTNIHGPGMTRTQVMNRVDADWRFICMSSVVITASRDLAGRKARENPTDWDGDKKVGQDRDIRLPAIWTRKTRSEPVSPSPEGLGLGLGLGSVLSGGLSRCTVVDSRLIEDSRDCTRLVDPR